MLRGVLLAVLFTALAIAIRAALAPDPDVVRHLRETVRRGTAPQPAAGETPQHLPLRVRAAQAVERLMARRNLWQSLSGRLQAADLNLRVGEFLLIWLGLGLVGGVIGAFFGGAYLLLVAALGLAAPWLLLGTRSQERKKQIATALPDALGTTANALRAGFSLLQALDACARQTKGALGQEFERLISETRVGVPIDEALENLARRADSPDLSLMVTAVQIQRQVGGNLAEVLDRIQFTIRERVRLQGEVRALSAQGRISALVIGAMPLALVTVMQVISPQFLSPMFAPGAGRVMLIVAALLQVVGFLALRRIVRIEV